MKRDKVVYQEPCFYKVLFLNDYIEMISTNVFSIEINLITYPLHTFQKMQRGSSLGELT